MIVIVCSRIRFISVFFSLFVLAIGTLAVWTGREESAFETCDTRESKLHQRKRAWTIAVCLFHEVNINTCIRIDYALNHMHKLSIGVFFFDKRKKNSVFFSFPQFWKSQCSSEKKTREKEMVLACLSHNSKYREMRNERQTFSHFVRTRSLRSTQNGSVRFGILRTMNQEIHKLEYNCRCLCIQIGLQ